MAARLVRIADILIDPRTQMRAATDAAIAQGYAERMGAGDTFPPVELMQDGDKFWVTDGHYRIQAAVKFGATEISANVKRGSFADAILAASGANCEHGMPRTNADKHRAIRCVLDNPEWFEKSNNWIAEQCRVSDMLVARVRETHKFSRKRAADAATGEPRAAIPRRHAPKGDADESAPLILCARCRRVGAVENCPNCKQLSAARRRKNTAAPAVELFDWRGYEQAFAALARLTEAAAKAHKDQNSVNHLAAKRILAEFLGHWKQWKKELSK